MSFTQKYPNSWFHVSGKPYPEFPDWRQLGSMYQEYMDAMDEYKAYYVSKRTSSLNVETVNLSANIDAGAGTQKFICKLNLADGGCYFPSYQAYTSLYISPDGDDVSVTGNGLYTLDVALSPIDNLIYLTPFTTTNIRTQDQTSFTINVKSNFTANWTNLATIGTVVADDGSIHFLPCALENEAARIHPSSSNYTMYGNIATSANQGRSFQAAINHNGILYTPGTWHIDGKWYMRKVDPVAKTINDIELYSVNTSLALVDGLACPYKNKILFITYRADNSQGLNYFDVTDNSTGAISGNFTVSNTSKGFLGPDGCYYLHNGTTGNMSRIDIEANTATDLGVSLQRIYCLSSSGYAYGLAPTTSANTSTTSFQRVKLFDVPIDPNFLCNRYLNTT